MKTCDTERFKELARVVADIFAKGLNWDEKAEHYLESVVGCEDSAELPAILRDSAHPEHRSLLELVYFPDLVSRLELEPVLREFLFWDQDIDHVAKNAANMAPNTRLITDFGPLDIPTSGIGAQLFFSRLHPQRRLDPEITAILEKHLPYWDAMRCRVHLRACREAFPQPARRLLMDFTREMADDPSFEDGFLHLLRLAPEIPVETDAVSALLSRRFQLESALDRAKQQEKDLASHAVETMLTQRASLLSVDVEAVRKEMDWLDRILVHIYQVMPAPKSGPEIALERGDAPQSHRQLFNFFSRFES